MTFHQVTARLVTVAAALLLGLLSAEAAVRLFLEVTDVPFYFWDPGIGPRIAPRQRGRYILGRSVSGRYNYNSQGWNYPEDFTIEKAAGYRRVCLVGDSQVESLQVDPDEAMHAVAERRSAANGRPVQWYPFGVSGFGTAQEYEVIRRYALDYRPDVVILLFLQNDPFDTSHYLVDLPPHLVRYVLAPDGELSFRPPGPWHPSMTRRLAAKSALIRYLLLQKGLLNRFRPRAAIPAVGGLPVREDALVFRHSLVDSLTGMSMQERQKLTWDLIAKLLEASRDECRRRGAVFAVAFRGWGDEIDAPIRPEPSAVPPRDVDPYCLGPRVREMGREWVGPIASRLGVPYLDLTADLRAEVARTRRSHRFPDDGHFSALGHAAAGEALARWVETLLP